MFPYRKMPCHITVLYIYTVVNFVVLFEVILVDAKISVLKDGDLVASFRDRAASFGAELDEPIEGFITLADPSDACDRIQPPRFLTNFTFSKFVLINGTLSGKCNSYTKAENAYKAGFDLAVIFDKRQLSFTPVHIGADLSIPAVFITWDDGLVIKRYYQYNERSIDNFILVITPNSEDSYYYIMLFAVVIGVCFIVMVLFMICLLVKCIQERRKNRRNRLSSRQIRQIPSTKFSKGDQYDVCAICLEDYNEGDKLRILPCSHAYHARCVDSWLNNNRRNCPLCKRKVTVGESSSDSDTDSELASPTENSPLLNSESNRRHTWGTFSSSANSQNAASAAGNDIDDLLERPGTSQYSGSYSPQGQHNAGAITTDSLVDESHHLPSASGSVNSSEGDDYTSINVTRNGHTTYLDPQHGLIV